MALKRLTEEDARAFEQEHPRYQYLRLGHLLKEMVDAIITGGGGGSNVVGTPNEIDVDDTTSPGDSILKLAAAVKTSLTRANTALQSTDIVGKADKAASPTAGNLAGLDSNGNPTDSGAKAADFVKMRSATTQIVDSDIALEKGKGLFGTDTNGTEHVLMKHAEYAQGQQTEVGSETDAICINWDALGWNGVAQPTGDNPPVNYKNTMGQSKADSLVLMVKDYIPLKAVVDSLVMGGLLIGSFTDKAAVPTTPSDAAWLKVPSVNDFFHVQADETHGGLRTQYYVTAVDIGADTMAVTYDGAFAGGSDSILVVDFDGTVLAGVIPDDGKPYNVYWNPGTNEAPNGARGVGIACRSGNNVVFFAVVGGTLYTGLSLTTATTADWSEYLNADDIDYKIQAAVEDLPETVDDVPIIPSTKNISLFRQITQDQLKAMILDPSLAEAGVKYYVPEADAGIEAVWMAGLDPANGVAITFPYTATQGGFVVIRSNPGTGQLTYSINGAVVARTSTPGVDGLAIIPVLPGQVLTRAGTLGADISIFYLPKFTKILNPKILVVEGGDDSLTEQPVMVNDGGVLRQKLDVFGNPLYKRTFTGNIVAAANTVSEIILDPSLADVYIDSYGGSWRSGSAYTTVLSVLGCRFTGGVLQDTVSIRSNQLGLTLYTLSVAARTGTTNNNYAIWVIYSKVSMGA